MIRFLSTSLTLAQNDFQNQIYSIKILWLNFFVSFVLIFSPENNVYCFEVIRTSMNKFQLFRSREGAEKPYM